MKERGLTPELVATFGLGARLAAGGHDTALAEELRDALARTLASMREHRELILREIAGKL